MIRNFLCALGTAIGILVGIVVVIIMLYSVYLLAIGAFVCLLVFTVYKMLQAYKNGP